MANVDFYSVTPAQYTGLTTKDINALYFLTNGLVKIILRQVLLIRFMQKLLVSVLSGMVLVIHLFLVL